MVEPAEPQKFKLSPILASLRQCNSLATFKQIHAQTLTTSLNIHNHLLAKLLHHLSAAADHHHLLRYATLLFSSIPRPNDFTFNVLIRALATTFRHYPLALAFHRRMLRAALRPNNFTFPFVLVAAANLPSLPHGRAAHASISKLGLSSDLHTLHSLITMYARCGDLPPARRLFDGIPQRDLVSWNSMISGYSKMGFASEAVELFRRMRDDAGFDPDQTTLVSALAACGDLGDLKLGVTLEELAVEGGLEMNSFLGSALVDMYGKCGDLSAARRVFDGLPKRDLVAWNSMITGYAQNGRAEEAVALFHAMRKAGVEPDTITLIGVLSACAAVGTLELGVQVDAIASRKGLHSNVYVGTALIDMYAKCGNLERAVEIFNGMPMKNTVSWNAMISALAFHGRGEEAISMFRRMRSEGETARPDDITFVGVLSACVHTGLVEEGRRWFDSMEASFGIVPKIEHYSCVVDLLARAGCLEEAWEFIEKMREKPDAVTLGALLCACRSRRNVEVGERVMKRILELEPTNSGNYVIASKIYAGSKRWDDSARMRGLMRERGVTKTPGCSWVEVDNQTNEFHSGDGLHHKSEEIHQMIHILFMEMQMEGYIPNIDLV